MDYSEIKTLAARQLEDYDRREPGTAFVDGLRLDVATAYAVQEEVTKLRQARGEQLVGYKVGCTSSDIRQQLGIDQRVVGRLFQSECHPSGARLAITDFCQLAIEGELAVELARTPVEADFLNDDLPACVARVFPVVELHHLVFRGSQRTAGELIANNAIHAGFVGGVGGDDSLEADAWSLTVAAGGQILGVSEGAALLDTIRSSVKWLGTFLRRHDAQLMKGDIVLTGSVPKLFPIREPCRINVQTQPFGDVTMEVTR